MDIDEKILEVDQPRPHLIKDDIMRLIFLYLAGADVPALNIEAVADVGFRVYSYQDFTSFLK